MTATDPPGATASRTTAPDADSPPAGGAALPVPTTPAPNDPPPIESGWGGWTRGYGRRGSALRQKLAAHLAARRRKRRAWARDIARIVLAVSMLALAVLAVEIGRKAVVVLNRADLGAVHLFGERG
ncbi:hypothetical protein [Azospirillum brasilense]|uniref:hypothetical protein n=1 Tax=Azospirillum brasilense TaxID=192 RepID=UPI0011EE709A|nr:hypothetical protein [Azospirillum brasilense]